MTFTEDQFNTLAKYDRAFRTAVESRWARNPGRAGLEEIVSIWNAATGARERANATCGTCIFRVLSDVGAAYLADARERIDAANDKTAAAATKAAGNPKKNPTESKHK